MQHSLHTFDLKLQLLMALFVSLVAVASSQSLLRDEGTMSNHVSSPGESACMQICMIQLFFQSF